MGCLDVTTQLWRLRIPYESIGRAERAVLSVQKKIPGVFNSLAYAQPQHLGCPQSFGSRGLSRPSSSCHHMQLAQGGEFSKSLVNRLNKVDAGTEFSRSLLSGIYWC